MKKRTLLFFIVGVSVAGISKLNAQFRVGGGLVYGTEIENIGINANGEYKFNDQWAVAPGLTYFLPKDIGGLDYTWFEFNANARYYFDATSVEPYVLGGLNFASLSIDYPDFYGYGNTSGTEVGLNLGGGVNFDIGSNVSPYGELRYVIGEADQLVIGGGVRFAF